MFAINVTDVVAVALAVVATAVRTRRSSARRRNQRYRRQQPCIATQISYFVGAVCFCTSGFTQGLAAGACGVFAAFEFKGLSFRSQPWKPESMIQNASGLALRVFGPQSQVIDLSQTFDSSMEEPWAEIVDMPHGSGIRVFGCLLVLMCEAPHPNLIKSWQNPQTIVFLDPKAPAMSKPRT